MDQSSLERLKQQMPRPGRAIYLAIVLCVFGYVLYSWVMFSGLYRSLAEFQVAQFGAYDVKLTFLALVFGLTVVPSLLIFGPIHAIRRLRGLPAINFTAPAPVPSRPRNPTTERRIYLGIGALGLVMALVGGAIGYSKSQRVITFVPFDLNSGVAPTSDYVELTGVAVPRMQVQFQETSGGQTKTTPYIPLLPRNWKKGDPITYFLRPNFTYYTAETGSYPVDTDSQAFRIKQTGVLFRDDLPGLVSARYEKNGIRLGTPPIVLDTNPQSELMPYMVTAIAGGIMVLMTPMLLVGMRIRNARTRKRVRA